MYDIILLTFWAEQQITLHFESLTPGHFVFQSYWHSATSCIVVQVVWTSALSSVISRNHGEPLATGHFLDLQVFSFEILYKTGFGIEHGFALGLAHSLWWDVSLAVFGHVAPGVHVTLFGHCGIVTIPG